MMLCPNCQAENRSSAHFCHQCGTRLPRTSTLAAGVVIQERYQIQRLLGQGGMGAVYLAADQKMFGKQYALKELLDNFTNPTDRSEAVTLFEQEARLLVTLNHPNLPQIVDYFQTRGRHYLVMEYVAGHTLETILRQSSGLLAEKLVVDWAVQLCDVLSYLHCHKPRPIIFRDLKPNNIMLVNQKIIKLIDFGIARLFDPAKKTDTLKMGSVGYAPPEQYADQGQTDPRSDLYALGATLHQLLTRRNPASQPFIFPPTRRLNQNISAQLEAVISRATNLDPEQRFSSADAMKQALLGQSAELEPVSTSTVADTDTPPQLIRWVQQVPVPVFQAHCIFDEKETHWAIDNHKLRCLNCNKTLRFNDDYQPHSKLRAYCPDCQTKTTWLVCDTNAETVPLGFRIMIYLCLGCGQTRTHYQQGTAQK